MKKKLILTAALFAATTAAHAEFKPAVQLDVRGRYESQASSAKGSLGQNADLLAIPAFSFGTHSVLPVFAVLQQGRGIESGLGDAPEFFFVRRNIFLAKPAWRWAPSERYVIKAWGGAKRAVNAEKDDTAWSLGLYDWEEFSGGLGGDLKLGGLVEKIGVGLELQHRTYMNWRESGTLVVGGKNYYSKDYNGWKATVDARFGEGPLRWNADLTWLSKGYTDSYVLKKVAGTNGETTNGTLDLNLLRADHLLRLGLDLGYALSKTISLSLDYGLDWNLSNQNFFDSTVNKGILDFYGYLSNGGGLSSTWRPKGGEGPALSVRAGLTNRVYGGRPVRDPGGRYREGKQADLEQSYSLDFAWPIWSGLSAVGGAAWINVLSNQGFANGSPTSYDLFSSSLGLKYQL